jgi:hypothetical protein
MKIELTQIMSRFQDQPNEELYFVCDLGSFGFRAGKRAWVWELVEFESKSPKFTHKTAFKAIEEWINQKMDLENGTPRQFSINL